MKTLYIDVYFLVNLTVDMLSLHFASKLSRTPVSFIRLFSVAFIGAVFSIIDILFINSAGATVFMGCVFFLSVAILCPKNVRLYKRFRFSLFFLVVQFILGGIVYFFYGMLEGTVGDYLEGLKGKPENRKAIIFSIIILFANGVLRLMLNMFSSASNEKTVKLKINIRGREICAEALVDSGNLVSDPMNMSPVLFIKPDLARKLMPENVIELSGIDMLDREYKKRIRLIPVTRAGQTHVMTGVRPDAVSVVRENNETQINLTVAIDKEGGTYGGYELLAPSVVINDAF